MTPIKRILLFAEPATLAHVARPVFLARALDPSQFRVEIATGPDFRHVAAEAGLQVRSLSCIGNTAYLAAVAAGRPVFPFRVLNRYVEDDLSHIRAFNPDLVVGDFRLSLAVSARLARIPYVAISNAYWSPYCDGKIEIPVHWISRMIGPRAANVIFRPLSPLVLALHSLPMDRLRRKYGMTSLGFDLRRVFTEADLTLFADVPEMVPTTDHGANARYQYIGPIVWSPAGVVPESLRSRADERPLLYVSMGNSGDPGLVRDIVEAATVCNCRVVVASSGRLAATDLPRDVLTVDFLPGAAVAAIAQLVVCNGGSPSTHQALGEGTPVLGLPANLDQLLNMQFVVASGAGLSLRGDRASQRRIAHSIERILNEPEFASRARTVSGWFKAYDSRARFAAAVQGMLVSETT